VTEEVVLHKTHLINGTLYIKKEVSPMRWARILGNDKKQDAFLLGVNTTNQKLVIMVKASLGDICTRARKMGLFVGIEPLTSKEAE